MKKILSLALAAALTFSLVSCGQTKAPAGSAGSADRSAPDASQGGASLNLGGDYIMGTGGTSGTYYPLGGALCQVLNHALGTNITANATGGAAENVRLISSGEVDLALAQTDNISYAMSGTVQFDKVTDGFGAVCSIYPEILHLVVRADSDIYSISDLKGKRVSVGDVGSGTESNMPIILGEYDMTYDDIKPNFLSYKESATAFQDGSIDAFFMLTGVPNTALTEVSITTDVRLVGITPELQDKIISNYPYFAKARIDGEAYNLEEGADSIAVKATLIASNDLSEEFVYQLTKAIFENLEEFGEGHANAKMLTLDSALEGIDPAHLHPGAVKYYKEAGML